MLAQSNVIENRLGSPALCHSTAQLYISMRTGRPAESRNLISRTCILLTMTQRIFVSVILHRVYGEPDIIKFFCVRALTRYNWTKESWRLSVPGSGSEAYTRGYLSDILKIFLATYFFISYILLLKSIYIKCTIKHPELSTIFTLFPTVLILFYIIDRSGILKFLIQKI